MKSPRRASKHAGENRTWQPLFSTWPRVLATLAYLVALHWAYVELISPTYDYMGMTYRAPDPWAYAGVVVAVLACAAALPGTVRRASDFMLWVIFLTTAAPSAVMAQYMVTLPVGRATVMGLTILAGLLVIRVGLTLAPRGVVPTVSLPPRAFFGGLTVFALAMYTVMIATGSLTLGFLGFAEVYAVRAEYKAGLLSLPLMGYLIPVLQTVVNPIFVGFGIYCRRILPLLFGVVGQVLIYLASGQKIVLLSMGVAAAVALLFRRNEKSASSWMIAGAFFVLVTVTAVFDAVAGRLRLTPVFLQRLVMLPAALTAAYVWVFSDYPKLNFSTVLPFLSTEYSETVSPFVLVGQLFNNADGNNANVNFFGDGYMHLGYAGLLIECLLVLALFWATDEVTRHVPLPLACIIFVMPTMAITNASAFTAVLTLGFGAAIALSLFLPSIESYPRKAPFREQLRHVLPTRRRAHLSSD